MTAIRSLPRSAALLFASVFLVMSLSLPAAQAGMIGTDMFANAEHVETQRQDILDLLEREQMREQLMSWGVEPADAEQRVSSMTAAEVQSLHDRMQDMPAGGSSVVGALLVGFLVLLVTDILGYTDVFPFTKSQAR